MSSAPKDTIVVAISDQPHSDFAFNWFVKYFMKPNQHIALVTVVKSPLETEFFTSSIGLGDNPIVYTPENIEKIKKQVKLRFVFHSMLICSLPTMDTIC